ncbi:MAG: PAS domain S-box protein [Hassallia sp. WJT32-NPBG1]|nr:PAS domain S-box protein [Hassallia sp. WJT32-NPBG1]
MYLTRSQIKFYGIAILAVVLALVMILMLNPLLAMTHSYILLFLGAVMLSAWYGGMVPGLLATCLCVIVSGYFFVFASESLHVDLANITRLSLFSLQGTLISVLCGALHKYKTEAQMSMRSLASSEHRCHFILDTTSEGICILDAQARTEYVNQSLAQMFGYTREEMLQRSIFDFIDESLHAEAKQHIEQRQRGIKQQFDFRFLRHDKSDLWAIASINPILNQENEFLGSLIMLTDISKRKQTEEALIVAEMRFASLAENVPGVICQYRQDPKGIGEFLYISSGCSELYEIDSEKIRQNPQLAWQLIHPQDFKDFRQSLIDYAATGKQWRHEWRIITPSGKIKWLQGTARSQLQPDKTVFWNGVVLDITELQAALRERERTEAKFRRIFESNMIGMKFWAGNGEITLANQAYFNIIGYTQEDLQTGRLKLSKITPPEYQLQEEQTRAEILQQGTCTPYEKEYIRKDGSRVPVLIGGARLDDGSDGGVCFVVDISDRKLLENQLRQQAAELESANRAKDQFLAVLSHELRTPLTSILGWTQIFLTRNLNEKNKTVGLETIERNARLQKQLIEDLLDISRILQGKLRLNVCPMNLVNVIEGAIRSLRSSAEEKSISLEFAIAPNHQGENADYQFPPINESADLLENDGNLTQVNFESRYTEYLPTLKLPETQAATPSPSDENPHLTHKAKLASQFKSSKFWVCGDSNRLQQVVYNLLSNAIRFTPKEGRIEITLSVQMGNEGQGDFLETRGQKEQFFSPHPPLPPSPPLSVAYAQITVKDTGIGISQEFLPYVFDRFRQADSSITRKFGGLGVGLAIVRHIVEMHGGTVTAQSPGEGQGATFTVNLPLLSDTTKD